MRAGPTLACLAILAGCSGEADFSGAIETQILPAEKYEQQIRTIDRLVFQDKPIGEDGARTLEATLDDVAARVCTKCDSRFLRLESLELKLLAKKAGRVAPDSNGFALQNDWMRIRNNLFDDRAWFARSARDLEEIPAQTETEPVKEQKQVVVRTVPPRRTLTGNWRVVAILANGQPRQDAEISGSTWTFDPPRLIMHDGTGHETVYNYNEEAGYISVMTPSGQEGWMKFELGDGGLRVAFFDGLSGKPESFDPVPGRKDPLLIVVRLVPV
jgi:hypothetical protein